MDTRDYGLEIVKKLVKAGYTAYFAGGWVRDFIMGHPSTDIDIATNAPPEKIIDLFPRTLLVGLSFGIVVVLIDGKQFEVASFRKDSRYLDGRHPEHIDFGTPEDDALRRDFTINGMFYDPIEDKVHDFVGGAEDIKKQVIRAIGNPHERFVEDRLRMIRAVRFSAKFGFPIEQETQLAIQENAETLFPAVSMERIWQEFKKMGENPRFDQALLDLFRLGLLQVIFPEIKCDGFNDIKKKVSSIPYFPEECPTVLYLLELFPKLTLDEVEEILKRIKVTNRDIKLVELMTLARELVAKGEEDAREWVYFYAHPDALLCLKAIAARYSEEERKAFLEKQEKKVEELMPHIKRVQLGKPLVTAALLQANGINPGKPMGLLLKEAERMVINHNRENAQEIIELLKQTPLWPKRKLHET